MKKLMLLLSIIALFSLISNKATGGARSHETGEALYNKHCSACHPNAEKLKSAKNIVKKIRRPIASMPAFDENKISNENAKKIDDYIHQDFDRLAKKNKNNVVTD